MMKWDPDFRPSVPLVTRGGGDQRSYVGVGQEGGDGPEAVGAADQVPDLHVELRQLAAHLREVLPGAHQREGARLAQRAVAERHVEQRLHLVLRRAAEDVVRPRPPGNKQNKQSVINTSLIENTLISRYQLMNSRFKIIYCHM